MAILGTPKTLSEASKSALLEAFRIDPFRDLLQRPKSRPEVLESLLEVLVGD